MAEYDGKNLVSESGRYPYRHHGPAVHGSKLADYLISEANLREDHPELFVGEEKEAD